MKKRIIIALAILLGLTLTTFAQKQPKWLDQIKKVSLLVTTREDILNIFGTPTSSDYEYDRRYELTAGSIDVEYSRGKCNEISNGTGNVPAFITTRIWFTPFKPISPKQLPFKLHDFQKHQIDDSPGAFTYENEEAGINFTLKKTVT